MTSLIILFTRENVASANIARKLIASSGFIQGTSAPDQWKRRATVLIDTKAPSVLDILTTIGAPLQADLLLVLSTHKGKNPDKVLTAHVPGNWSNADFGGSPRTLNTVDGPTLKILIQELKRRGDLIGWKVSLEADHHGPTCDKPILFVEIGNGEAEWADESAAEAVAAAVAATIDRIENPKPETFETAFCVGGGHYPRLFTKLELENPKIAIGHVAPKYVIDSIDEDTFRQAIEKSVTKVTKVIISKDETSSVHREKIKKLAEKFDLPCEML